MESFSSLRILALPVSQPEAQKVQNYPRLKPTLKSCYYINMYGDLLHSIKCRVDFVDSSRIRFQTRGPTCAKNGRLTALVSIRHRCFL
jgi:hypothetical protein